ncbi:hypothetical protein QQS21_012729, partial [Conoideocrella luteorostrata]
EISETLSDNPKLASVMRYLNLNFAAKISSDLHTPPPDIPNHTSEVAMDHGSGASYSRSQKANKQTPPRDSRLRTLLPRPVERPHQPGSQPLTPNTQTNIKQIGRRAPKRKRDLTQNLKNKPMRDLVLARAAAEALVNELGTKETIIEVQQMLLIERERGSLNVSEPVSTLHWNGNATESEISSESDVLQKLLRMFESNERLQMAANRYWGCQYVDSFNQRKELKKNKSSLGVAFTKSMQKSWVRDLQKEELPEKYEREKMRAKSKSVVKKNSLCVLRTPNKQKILLEIEAKYPNLKADLKDLNEVAMQLFTFTGLPERKLVVETLSESGIRKMSQTSLRELVSFVDSTMPVNFDGIVYTGDTLRYAGPSAQDPQLSNRAGSMPMWMVEQSVALQSLEVIGPKPARESDETQNYINPAFFMMDTEGLYQQV